MYYMHGIPWHFLLGFDLHGTRYNLLHSNCSYVVESFTDIYYRLRRHVIVTRHVRSSIFFMYGGWVIGVTGGRLSKARAPRVVFSWIIVARILE
jgi:hypothetical protein